MAIAPSPSPQAPQTEDVTDMKRARTTSPWTSDIMRSALIGSLTKLNPRTQARNPVMWS